MRVFLFALVYEKRLSAFLCVCFITNNYSCSSLIAIFFLCLVFRVLEKSKLSRQLLPLEDCSSSQRVEPPLLRVALGNKESITPTTTVERKARVSIING